MKRTVGLLVLAYNGDQGSPAVAILQRTGEFDYSKGCRIRYPGSLRLTCQGEIKENETEVEGLTRIVITELGLNFASEIMSEGLIVLPIIHEEVNAELRATVFGCLIQTEIVAKICLRAHSGGLARVEKERLGELLTLMPAMQLSGPLPSHESAISTSDRSIVREAFTAFS